MTAAVLIREGWAVESMTSREGHRVILRLHGPGDLFGDWSVATGYRAQTTVRALTTVEGTSIDWPVFNRLFADDQHMSLVLHFIRQRSLEAADRRLLVHSTLGVPERLALLIVEIADRFDDINNGVVIPFTQEELAQWIGTTRTSITRVLTGWRNRGLVTTQRRTLTITDMKNLRQRYARDWVPGSPRTWT